MELGRCSSGKEKLKACQSAHYQRLAPTYLGSTESSLSTSMRSLSPENCNASHFGSEFTAVDSCIGCDGIDDGGGASGSDSGFFSCGSSLTVGFGFTTLDDVCCDGLLVTLADEFGIVVGEVADDGLDFNSALNFAQNFLIPF